MKFSDSSDWLTPVSPSSWGSRSRAPPCASVDTSPTSHTQAGLIRQKLLCFIMCWDIHTHHHQLHQSVFSEVLQPRLQHTEPNTSTQHKDVTFYRGKHSIQRSCTEVKVQTPHCKNVTKGSFNASALHFCVVFMKIFPRGIILISLKLLYVELWTL